MWTLAKDAAKSACQAWMDANGKTGNLCHNHVASVGAKHMNGSANLFCMVAEAGKHHDTIAASGTFSEKPSSCGMMSMSCTCTKETCIANNMALQMEGLSWRCDNNAAAA